MRDLLDEIRNVSEYILGIKKKSQKSPRHSGEKPFDSQFPLVVGKKDEP
jgi:hypothetical protein